MSTLVNFLLCPNREDYDLYGCSGNAYSGFPTLWPAEVAANAAVLEEQRRIQAYRRMMGYTRTRRLLEHFRSMRHEKKYMAEILRKALAQLGEKLPEAEQPRPEPCHTLQPLDNDIAAYALATLAEENGWQRTTPARHNNYTSIYRIR